jgi:mannosyltransferase OCH1-like enzyme
MKISYSIMAHPKRKEMVEYLFKELGEVPVNWDRNKGIWDTCKNAWLKYDKDADYHFVVQDDTILCKDFKKRVLEFVEKEPNEAYQLYMGKRKNKVFTEEDFKKGYSLRKHLSHGVAIGLKTDLIEDMVKFGDGFQRYKQDDMKIRHFLVSKNIRTMYPVPSLVSHRQENSLVEDKGEMRIAEHFIDNMEQKIPKILHQVWIGPKQQPKEWMDTWKEKHPDWEYVLWDEKSIDEFGLENRKLYDMFYKAKVFNGCANIVRTEVLYKYGGVYVDADSICLRPLNEDWLKYDYVAGRSPNNEFIKNSVLMCKPKDEKMKDYINFLKTVEDPFPSWQKTGSKVMTPILLNKPNGLLILPSWVFSPINMKGKKHEKYKEAYCDHFWGITKGLYK